MEWERQSKFESSDSTKVGLKFSNLSYISQVLKNAVKTFRSMDCSNPLPMSVMAVGHGRKRNETSRAGRRKRRKQRNRRRRRGRRQYGGCRVIPLGKNQWILVSYYSLLRTSFQTLFTLEENSWDRRTLNRFPYIIYYHNAMWNPGQSFNKPHPATLSMVIHGTSKS